MRDNIGSVPGDCLALFGDVWMLIWADEGKRSFLMRLPCQPGEAALNKEGHHVCVF